jgi:hypothetical protein
LNVLEVFSLTGSKIDGVTIAQTHDDDGENGKFFLFLQQKKIRKSSIFSIITVMFEQLLLYRFSTL